MGTGVMDLRHEWTTLKQATPQEQAGVTFVALVCGLGLAGIAAALWWLL